jgi:hypothetical protein
MALSIQAHDGGLEHVCRVRHNDSIFYRAHGHGSGITVEVTSQGDVLWRHWEGKY